MTQPNLLNLDLLELAKQGDPQAIATLMNQALEPEGVVAKAALEGQCLHVFLSAARALNAKTLVTFIQRGILRLEVSSIQRVLVYGQRLGSEQPDWVEAFVLPYSSIAEALEALSHPSSTSAGYPDTMPVPELSPPTLMDEWKQQWATQTQQIRASCHQAVNVSKQWIAQKRDRLKASHETSNTAREIPALSETPVIDHIARLGQYPPSYFKLSIFVTLVAFLTGGGVALIAHFNTLGHHDRTADGKVSAIAVNSQQAIRSEAERTRQEQQTSARKYLETMNKAQQAFYRQNNRFASTLEELERFAAVPIASRSDYTYKLTVPSRTQSQLSAVPKADGLKSYTAAVSIAKATNQAIATICTSQQAAKVPPLVFQSPEGKVQCPVESTKAP